MSEIIFNVNYDDLDFINVADKEKINNLLKQQNNVYSMKLYLINEIFHYCEANLRKNNFETSVQLDKYIEDICFKLAKFMIKNGLDYFESEPIIRNGQEYIEKEDTYLQASNYKPNFFVVYQKIINKYCIYVRALQRINNNSYDIQEIEEEMNKANLIASIFKNDCISYKQLVNLEGKKLSDFDAIIEIIKSAENMSYNDQSEAWIQIGKLLKQLANIDGQKKI